MIREARPDDIPAMLEIYRPYVTQTAYTFEYAVPTLVEFTGRFRAIAEEFPWLVWEENGQVLGYCYGAKAFERAAYQWAADLSIYLRTDCQGRGAGRKLYEAVMRCLTRQGYRLAYGLVTTENAGSCGFHRAMGFRETAQLPRCGWKFGRWYGVTWFEKCLNEQDPVQPPESWKQVRCEFDF